MSSNFSTGKSLVKYREKGRFLPNKTLGQNFLEDKNQVKKIIEAADLEKGETVLEIGPGLGAITIEMASRVKKVFAVEKDGTAALTLKGTLDSLGIKNVEIIEGDILEFFKDNRLEIKGLKEYKVVANIPYYLTSFLIRNLLEIENKPQDIFLMIQKEVARRICQKPPRMSLLSVSVNYYSSPKILFNVSKNSFRPRPKVDSSFIRLTPNGKKKNDDFFEIVRAGFSHPRKQLISNLESLGIKRGEVEKWLERANIDGKRRAETISIEEWDQLAKGKSIIE